MISANFPPPTFQPDRSGGSDSPGCSSRDRPVWLLDEPTVSLDTASSERLVAAVNAHTKSGGIAVIATHLPLALDSARTLQLAHQRIAA